MPVPPTAALSPSRLARIDALLQRDYIDAGRLAGTQLLVARRGEIAHLSSLGLRDRERGLAMAEDTIFRIYSMTKPITCLALMMLFEQGLVALDDPVHRFIPAWGNMTVLDGDVVRPVKRPMRVLDLLRHTSGLTYGFQERTPVDKAYRERGIGAFDGGPLEEMVAALAQVPLEFDPGTLWNYSVSTDVIGYIVERVSGLPFAAFLKQRIFDPLGMVDTGFWVPEDQQHRFAACYARKPREKLALETAPIASGFTRPPRFVSGGGGLVSTTADYYRFCQMLLGGGKLGETRLVSRKTLALMAANHLPGGVDLPALSVSLFSEAAYAGVGFGLGLATTIDPAATLMPGSAGDMFWGGMASTFFWVDPAEGLVCIFMTQLIPANSYPIRRQLRTMVYAAIDD